MGLDDLKRAMEQRRLLQEAQANGSLPVGAPDNMLRQNMQANPQTPGILQQFSNLGNTMMDRSSELRNDPLGALKRAAQNAITGIGADPTMGQARLPGTNFLRDRISGVQDTLAEKTGEFGARHQLPDLVQQGLRGVSAGVGAGLEVVKEQVAPDAPAITAAVPLMGPMKAVAGKMMSPVFRPKLSADVIFKKQGKMAPDQIRAAVRNLGAKEESAIAGVESFLKGKKSVSKADFEAHMAKKGLALEERVLGAEIDGSAQAKKEFDELGEQMREIGRKEGEMERMGPSPEQMERFKATNRIQLDKMVERRESLRELAENQMTETRWGRNGTQADYTLAGPLERDKEILIKNPVRLSDRDEVLGEIEKLKKEADTLRNKPNPDDFDPLAMLQGKQKQSPEDLATSNRITEIDKKVIDLERSVDRNEMSRDASKNNFTDSTHFPDDPGLLLWVRTNMRRAMGIEGGELKALDNEMAMIEKEFANKPLTPEAGKRVDEIEKARVNLSGGAKIQFLEELQSSWHQKARELWKGEVNRIAKAKGISKGEAAKEVDSGFGYKKGVSDEAKKEAEGILVDLKEKRVGAELLEDETNRLGARSHSEKMKIDQRLNDIDLSDASTDMNHPDRASLKLERKNLISRLGEIRREHQAKWDSSQQARSEITRLEERYRGLSGDGIGVPDAPFKKTGEWASVGLKRWLREGADNDAEFMAWTTGKQQIDRYDDAMRKNVDFIEWGSSNAKGEIDEAGDSILVTAIKGEESVFAERFSKATGKSERAIQSPTGSEIMDLSEVVGKSTAEKIMASPEGKLKDLSIGGEGMKNFYDVMVPKFLKEIFKKNGLGKVEFVEVPIGQSADASLNVPFQSREKASSILNQGGEVYGVRNGSEELIGTKLDDLIEAELDGPFESFIMGDVQPQATQPAIKLTPEQRKKIQEGLLLSDVGGEDDGERVA